MMTVLLTICLFLYCKNLKKTKGNNDKNDKTDEILQEAKSKDGSATDEPLLLASQNLEVNKG